MEKTQPSTSKHLEKVSDMTPIDRISALPDAVLCHILSFLPTRLAIQTSAIAKRWRPLWALVPSLRFDFHISSDVVYRVMMLHKSKTIDTFCLSYVATLNECQLDTWITSAIERKVKTLDIIHARVMLPLQIFTCKTLVDLRLADCTTFPSGCDMYLPNLKKLLLRRVNFEVVEDLPRLLTGCPVLDVLAIVTGNVNRDLGCFNISSASIKRLSVIIPFYNPSCEVRVVIDAPEVTYLKVSTCYYEHLTLLPMPSLVEADMYLHGTQAHFYCDLSIKELFDCFPNVKCLKIAGSCKFPEGEAGGSIVRFRNLTKLDLGLDWHVNHRFLESADNLEDLIINEVSSDRRNLTEHVEDRPLQSLRTVAISGFACTEQELILIKYFLRNAPVLKRIETYVGRVEVTVKKMVRTLKRVLKYDRASKDCEVAFD